MNPGYIDLIRQTRARGAGAEPAVGRSPQLPRPVAPAPESYDAAHFEDERDLRAFTNLTDAADEMGGV